MQLMLNGEIKNISATTLDDLVIELKLEQRTIAIELNNAVVPRSEYHSTNLQKNDKLEIVHMIGGG
ncbi:MAG: sulfur carrier protein ThiS [Mariprofundaceae bacterium]|nr:sulfur carrier protein ThiS [Mariprofundaceae bacterium]